MMFCATCFQTAEIGSRYCSGCRQAREAKGEAEVAWSVLPEASEETWGAALTQVWRSGEEATSGLDSSAWDEGPVWRPPVSSQGSQPDPANSLDPSPAQSWTPMAADCSAPVPADSWEPLPEGSPLEPPAPRAATRPAQEAEALTVSHSPLEPTESPSPGPPAVYAGHYVAVGSVPPQPSAAPALADEPSRRRGNKAITGTLLVSFVLLSMTAVALVLGGAFDTVRVAAASPAETAQPLGESSETAQRFLNSAKASMEAKDFELAALQLEKAVEELLAAGAPETEVSAAQLLLGQARFKEGELEKAHAICAQLFDSEVRAQAKELSRQVEKELRKQAESMLASGRDDLQAGRLTPALEKARRAQKMLAKYGGSADQGGRAKALLVSAERAGGRLGLERPRRPIQAPAVRQAQQLQQGSQQIASYPRQRRIQQVEPQQPLLPPRPDMRRQPSQQRVEVSPGSLPIANAMRRQRRQQQQQQQQPAPPEQPLSLPEGQPEMPSTTVLPAQQPTTSPGQVAVPPTSSRRTRAGSGDVLPTYNSEGGGSAY